MITRTMAAMSPVQQQAEILVKTNREADPDIVDVYWFPAKNEIRLVETVRNTLPTPSGELEPFYFEPSPKDGILLRSAIALIEIKEAGKLKLPSKWGSWKSAKKL